MSVIVRAVNKLRECAARLMRPYSPQEDSTLGQGAARVAGDLEQILLAADQRVVADWPRQPLAWDEDVAAPGQGHGWIQWKGTNVCMDVHCPCGTHGHVDDAYCYFYRCPGCKHLFALGQTIRLYELTPECEEKYGDRGVFEPDLEEA